MHVTCNTCPRCRGVPVAFRLQELLALFLRLDLLVGVLQICHNTVECAQLPLAVRTLIRTLSHLVAGTPGADRVDREGGSRQRRGGDGRAQLRAGGEAGIKEGTARTAATAGAGAAGSRGDSGGMEPSRAQQAGGSQCGGGGSSISGGDRKQAHERAAEQRAVRRIRGRGGCRCGWRHRSAAGSTVARCTRAGAVESAPLP